MRKPCPFCASDDLSVGYNFEFGKIGENDTDWPYKVSCNDCCTYGPIGDTKEIAIERWNKRIINTPIGGFVEKP
jgi:Lar family restriction alleviation protein